jgi:hypothetical protein
MSTQDSPVATPHAVHHDATMMDAITSGDSPLSSQTASSVSSVPTNPSDDDIEGEMIEHLEAERKKSLKVYAEARKNDRIAESDEALMQVQRIGAELEVLRNAKKPKDDAINESKKRRRFGGLQLSTSDLPKFRIASERFTADTKGEWYVNARQFLKKFEAVMNASSENLEDAWLDVLPLCLDKVDNDAWIEQELKKCLNWAQAKEAFIKEFASNNDTFLYTSEVWTMVMNSRESISEYSRRFSQKVFLAGLKPTSAELAQRFLASLLQPIQTVVRMSFNRYTDVNKVTFEQIAREARNILGDDPHKYETGVSLLAGASSSYKNHGSATAASARATPASTAAAAGARYKNDQGSSNARPRRRQQQDKQQEKKDFYCTQHGKNATHNTGDCISLKRREERRAIPRPCRDCGADNWTPAHRAVCTKKPHDVFAVKNTNESQKENGVVAAGIQEGADTDMSEANYDGEDCKYKKGTVVNQDSNKYAFRMLTPLLVNGIKLIGRVDTGSDITILDLNSFNKKLSFKNINSVPTSSTLQFLFNNSKVKSFGKTDLLKIQYANGISFEHSMEILDFHKSFDFDVLLGKDILPKMNIGLTGVAFRLDGEHKVSDNPDNDERIFESLNIKSENSSKPDESPYGTHSEIEKFLSSIKESLEKNKQIPVTAFCTMPEAVVSLPTKEGAKAYRRQYPIPKALEKTLDDQIKKWLDADVIEKSKANTQFNAPLLLIPKRARDGTISGHRPCMDVRELNRLLPPAFNYQNENIKDILASFNGAKIFSTLDLSEAFLKCPVEERDRHKLTFTHDRTQYCFKRACFGLTFMSSFFSKLMSILFDDMKGCVRFYCDDICIASRNVDEHISDVKRVVDRLTSVKLTLQPKKCVWFQKSVRLLGFVIDETGWRVDPSKITNVAAWPIPTTGKQIQQFSGLVNYVRDFVPLISRVAEPITSLSNCKDVSKVWTEKHTKAFTAIKEILQSNMILHYPDLNREFYVATDASKYAVGGLLYQKDDSGRDKFIAFMSSTLVHSQRRWGTTKRELYALVLSLRKFRTYIYGRKITVFTDHQALVYLHTQERANDMMIGWLETLLDYDFTVVHIPGILNKLPDALSRLYPPIEDDDDHNSVHKLVEDRQTSVTSRKGKTYVKRQQFSKDRNLNVLAMNLIENKQTSMEYMIPPVEERDIILQDTHKFGHFGSQAIVKEIHSKGLHWENIYKEATDIVKSCIECQRHNVAKRGYHPLTNIVALRPFDHIALDLAGPLPITDEGEIYLLVVVDICTKYVVLRAMKNKQSDTVVRALVSIAGDYSFPRIISSDNGLEFKNILQNKLNEALGIDRRYTTPYHPRGNGAAEASVKTALSTIRKMSQSNGRDWAHHLPMCQLSMNNAIKNRTMSSPFSLMYARRVNVPDDYANTKRFPLPKEMMTPKQLEDQIEKMETIVFPAIKERTNKILEERKKKFDNSKVIIDIPVGTHVMVRLQHRPNKLAPLYEGPYTVIRRNKGGSYELKDEQNELLHRNYVPSELKVVNIDESKIEDTYYEVDDIRSHRGNAGNREYLVKWKGYGERDNTWQKASDFTDANIVQKYWDKVEQLEAHNQRAIKHRQIPSADTSIKTNTNIRNKKRLPPTLSREERYNKRRAQK